VFGGGRVGERLRAKFWEAETVFRGAVRGWFGALSGVVRADWGRRGDPLVNRGDPVVNAHDPLLNGGVTGCLAAGDRVLSR
jgi:hypothetical protein